MLFVLVAFVVASQCFQPRTARADAAAASDPLPLHSKWEGTQDANASHAKDHDVHCKMTVTARDGDQFTAEYGVGAHGDKLKIQGVVNAHGTIKCVPVEVQHGAWEKDILKDQWSGTIDGDKLVFQRWNSQIGGNRTTELTRKGSEKD